MPLVFSVGKFAGQTPLFVEDWYLAALLGDVTNDGLRWSALTSGEKSEVIAEIRGRVAGQRIGESGIGKKYYIDTVSGDDDNNGQHPSNAFLTGAAALAVLASHDTVFVSGKLREQLIAPLGVRGVAIIGNDTRPRHDNAASWIIPADPTAGKALIEVLEEGWVFANLLFQSHETNGACVRISRAEDAVHPDGGKTMFLNCRFDAGDEGIEDNGGSFNVLVDGCIFRGVGGTAIKSISTGVALPLHWEIRNCRFHDCTNCIVMPFSKAYVHHNIFQGTITTTYNGTGGLASNFIVDNTFDINAGDFDPAGGVTGLSGDVWSNRLKDTLNEHGLPAN